METEYSSYKLGLTQRRASRLVSWLWEKFRLGQVTAKEMAHIRLLLCYPVQARGHEDLRRVENSVLLASRQARDGSDCRGPRDFRLGTKGCCFSPMLKLKTGEPGLGAF